MRHERATALLAAYADRQLGPLRRLLVGRHAAACPTCLAALDGIQTMRLALRTNLPVHRAPPSLALRIESALEREAVPLPAPARPRRSGFAGAAFAGGFAGVALTLAVTGLTPAPSPLIADAVADHVRSMMVDHLTDVPSTDRHTVKPWLTAQLDLAPVVKDLKAEGFPLIGGRLDYLANRRAAAMVYHRDRHVINLFAYRGDEQGDAPFREESRDGFNIVRWRMGGLTYIAVSDVEAPQLLAFARLVAEP